MVSDTTKRVCADASCICQPPIVRTNMVANNSFLMSYEVATTASYLQIVQANIVPKEVRRAEIFVESPPNIINNVNSMVRATK